MSKKKSQPQRPNQMSWNFGGEIPTHDFFEERDLDDPGDLEEAVENFVSMVEDNSFLTWEAVVSEEQGLPLTPRQKKALGEIINLAYDEDEDDDHEESIHYIDEGPRPSEPWHVILNRIVPHLLIEPYRTFDGYEEVKCEGWNFIHSALLKHGKGLSLPTGANAPDEVIPAELRHKLWLQWCFEDLSGLGHGGDLTLENPEEYIRIEWFINSLQEHKETVEFFGLTLDSLLARVELKENDRLIFIELMQKKLGLSSTKEPILGRLKQAKESE